MSTQNSDGCRPNHDRIPFSVGAGEYKTAWNNVAESREHAFELVDESTNEEQIDASGAHHARYLVDGLDLNAKDVVLEVGCGVARLGKHVAPHVKEWWGLDVSERMVEIARDRCAHLSNVHLLAGSGSDLSALASQSFDKVYCHAVLIHMDKEDVYSYLVEVGRVLKPGGLFYFDVWNICHPVGWLRWQVERKLYATRSHRPPHRNQFSSPDEVRAMLAHTNLEVVQLVESFYVQTVATVVPEGRDAATYCAARRDQMPDRLALLKYGDGDAAGFAAVLSSRLLEFGIQPEL